VTSARTTSYRFYWKLRELLTPGLRSSQDAYAQTLRAHVNGDVEWLDLGCGHQVLPDWHAKEEQRLVATCKMVVGVDCDLPSLAKHQTIRLRAKGDIAHLPFKEASFNLVTANMVIEHLQNPARQFAEIGRILKTGGLCILLTPNAYGYPTLLARLVPRGAKNRAIRLLEGRGAEDVFPAYYRANTQRALKAVAESNSLEIVKVTMATTDALFAVLPPVVALELLWIRILMTRPFRGLRPNILAVLRKRPSA
jgi:ubiquinone/menaquinone biosynthesis C-methylase UbiE